MKPKRKELISTIKALLRFATGIDDPNGGTIYKTMNPYCRPVVKEALMILAKEQGIKDWLSADIKGD